MIARPGSDEFAPYFGKYIALVGDGDSLLLLEAQGAATVELLRGLTEAQGEHRYAAGKWSIKEVIGHLTDAERVFAYRALRVARGDKTPLAGFEQDEYVATANFGRRTVADLASEFQLVRRSNLVMFRSFSDEAWLRRGSASNGPVSTRALAYIIAGHELHHDALLRSKYL